MVLLGAAMITGYLSAFAFWLLADFSGAGNDRLKGRVSET